MECLKRQRERHWGESEGSVGLTVPIPWECVAFHLGRTPDKEVINIFGANGSMQNCRLLLVSCMVGLSKCVSFLLPWTGVLYPSSFLLRRGSLSTLISSAGDPGVKCFWAMQEGGLGEPPPPSQGPGVDLERERVCEGPGAGEAGRGRGSLQRVRLTGAILEGEAVTTFALGGEIQ